MNYKFLTGQLLADYQTLATGINGFGASIVNAGDSILKINNDYHAVGTDIFTSFQGQIQHDILTAFSTIVNGLNGVTEGISVLFGLVTSVLEYYKILDELTRKSTDYNGQKYAASQYANEEQKNKRLMDQVSSQQVSPNQMVINYNNYDALRLKYMRLKNSALEKAESIENEAKELITTAEALRADIISRDSSYVYNPNPIAVLPADPSAEPGKTNELGVDAGWDTFWRAFPIVNTVYIWANPMIATENVGGVNAFIDSRLRTLTPWYGWLNPMIPVSDAVAVSTNPPTVATAGPSFLPTPFTLESDEYNTLRTSNNFNTGNALATIDTSSGAEDTTVNPTNFAGVTGPTSTFLRYAQGDYSNVSYNGGSVKSEGCGVAATATVLSGYEGDVSIKSLASEMNRSPYRTTLQQVTDTLSDHGLKVSDPVTVSKKNAEQVVTDLKSHLENGGQAVVLVGKSSTNSNPTKYTKGGHFITITGIKDDGKTLIIKNPSGSSSNGTVDELVIDFMANYVPNSNGKTRPPRGLVYVYGKED